MNCRMRFSTWKESRKAQLIPIGKNVVAGPDGGWRRAREINTPLAYVKHSLGASLPRKLPVLGGAIDNSGKLLDLLRAGNDAEELSRQFALASGVRSGN